MAAVGWLLVQQRLGDCGTGVDVSSGSLRMWPDSNVRIARQRASKVANIGRAIAPLPRGRHGEIAEAPAQNGGDTYRPGCVGATAREAATPAVALLFKCPGELIASPVSCPRGTYPSLIFSEGRRCLLRALVTGNTLQGKGDRHG